jgi:hypothetical protein
MDHEHVDAQRPGKRQKVNVGSAPSISDALEFSGVDTNSQFTFTDSVSTVQTISFDEVPEELRNAIHEYLLDDIVAPRKDVTNLQVPYPNYNFSWYLNMLVTSRGIRGELSSLFFKECLPHLTFYFTNIAHLRIFNQVRAMTNLRYENLRINVCSIGNLYSHRQVNL